MPYNTAPIPPRIEASGTTQLPLSRVKKMLLVDPDIHAAANAASFVLTVATEMFIQHLAERAHDVVKSEKKPRRNIQYRDLANAVSHHDNLEFLVDIVPKTMPYKEAKKLAAGSSKTSGESSVEAGQTTLDSVKPVANGTNGNGSYPPTIDDDEDADPNEQLKMESRGPRLSSGSTISNPVSNGPEDVEMG
ncbi:Histone-like transcription factor and archaeal histone family protein [Diplocarpon rosae]|nr:Histone-like transcription factor and archaeal histone family protein [Diplocarpon rosae]